MTPCSTCRVFNHVLFLVVAHDTMWIIASYQCMLVNARDSNLNHQNVKNCYDFISLVTNNFVCMYHHKIQFYNYICKLSHKGQRSRSHSDIFDIPT